MTTTATQPRTSAATGWTVDADASTVEFAVKTLWGLSTVHGRFDRFDGSYDNGPGGTTIKLRIDADSLETGNRMRDRHLRSTDFFDVAEHPQVRFTSTRVHEMGGGVLHVVGWLEARGRSVLLEFPAIVRLAAGSLEVEATATVDHRELGMSSGTVGMIRPPVTLHVNARLSRL